MSVAADAEGLPRYRRAARAWIAEHLVAFDGDDPDLVAERTEEHLTRARHVQQLLHGAGYAGFTFPVEHGGQGLTPEHERVFREEAAGHYVPERAFGVSINVLGATLVAFGTEAQKAAHAPRILSGDELWLQLLSEPGGGSDPAGLLMSARRDGDHYVLNGQKTWSSGANLADFALCPVRTAWDVPKHRGISVLIVDLRSPGIEIRPIRQMNGEAHFCEEFFTDVAVPVTNLVGDEDDGWRVVRGLLGIEHAWVGRGGPKRNDSFDGVAELTGLVSARGTADDPRVRDALAALYVATEVQRLLVARVAAGPAAGPNGAPLGGLLKMGRDQLIQRVANTALGFAGPGGTAWDATQPGGDEWAQHSLNSRSASISGGTAEIQRNNVGERVLGLPREPSVDREIPFSDVAHN
jgi:alkylation response protein AidB-like acyl-CoA dehydrogenase